MVEKKTSFLYTIQHPCKMQVYMTSDPEYAQTASRMGMIVHCKMIASGNKVYKHSND